MARNRTITIPPDVADRISAILEATAEDAKLAFARDPSQYSCNKAEISQTCDEMIYVARKLRGINRRPTLPETPIAKLRLSETETERMDKIYPGELDDFDSEPTTVVDPPITMENLIHRQGI